MALDAIPEVREITDIGEDGDWRSYTTVASPEEIDVQMGSLVIRKEAGKKGVHVTIDGNKVPGLHRLEMVLDYDRLPEVVLHMRPTLVPSKEK